MDTIDFWVVPSEGQIRCIGHWQQWPWVEAGARKGTKIEGENYDATPSRLQVVSNNKFVHAQSLDNMQCRRSAKNFALFYLSPNCSISYSVNNRWNFLRFYGFFFVLYFCSGTQDVLVSWKRRSLEEWKFEVPFIYNLLYLKHFNTCSFSGHNPIYYSRRNSFISCVESVMFEKMSHLGTPAINHQL